MNNTKVSIIMPSYNSMNYISNSINSVVNQTYESWELIIVDDCSKDDTQHIVSNYCKNDNRIKLFVNEKNLGSATSRNMGIKKSSGRYIAFLDSDDLWHQDKLSKQVNFMRLNKYSFTYSYYSKIDEQGLLLKNIDNLPEKVSYISTLKSNKIGCLTAIYDTEFFGKVYMENLKKRQDLTLWLKLLKENNYAYCCKEILANYRIRKNSLSRNKLKLVKFHWLIYRKIEKQNFINSTYYLLFYIYSKIFINK
jgi:teichuronic acid biosynthesis glycosyltransferase TuaG